MIPAALVIAFMLSCGATAWLASARCGWRVLDLPNDRSLHSHPTSRTGGLAILAGIAASWPIIFMGPGQGTGPLPVMILAVVPVAAVSFLDDLRPVSPLVRLLCHGLAALIFLKSGLGLAWNGWLLFAWLAMVWMINLYNFMDGMDGFAGGMGVAGFAFLALAAGFGEGRHFAFPALAVAAANGGFLLHNFPPARIFMGDAGSASMGFLAAAFGLWGISEHLFSWWLPILVFSPFIIDASVTLCRRMLNREKIWQAHRSHYYQRLVGLGWGHEKTVTVEYCLMLTTGISAILLHYAAGPVVTGAGIAFWAMVYVFLIFLVGRLERSSKTP